MRYAEFRTVKADLDAAIRRHVNNPLEAQRFKLEQETCRLYPLAPNVEIHFNPGMLDYGNGVTLRRTGNGSLYPDLTSQVLSAAADCVRHIEAWVAGEIDDLLPSGPWMVGAAKRGR